MVRLAVPLNDGNSIPWLAYGTGTALYNQEVKEEVLLAINSGIHHIDGAQVYRNEKSIGDAIAESGLHRSSFFVTTKLNTVPAGGTVKDTLLMSLRKLNLEYVDLFLIHNPRQHTDLKAVWKQFEELKKEGLAKSIGVSNFRVQDFEQILDSATIIPSVNQVEYHPYVFKKTQPVIELQKKYNITTASYGGLSPITRFPGGSLDPVLESVAKKVGDQRGKPVSAGQVLQLWLRTKGIVAVSTSRKKERLQEYLDVETLPDLSSEDVDAIEEAGSEAHHRVFMKWIDETP